MNKTALATIAVVILIALGVWYYMTNKPSMSESLVGEENAVLIEDQQPGDETVVTYAKLSQPGYVAVYSTNTTGDTVLLGTSDLLEAGEHRQVRVRHTNPGTLITGSILTGRVIADDGDGEFSEENDSEVLAEDGAEADAEAELDLTISDEELAELLDDAGYNVMMEADVEAEAEDSSGAAGIQEEGSMMEPIGAADEGVSMEAELPEDENQ